MELYKPEVTVGEFLAEEHARLERDKRIVKDFQRKQAEARAIRLHRYTLPWAITLLGLATAAACYLAKFMGGK